MGLALRMHVGAPPRGANVVGNEFKSKDQPLGSIPEEQYKVVQSRPERRKDQMLLEPARRVQYSRREATSGRVIRPHPQIVADSRIRPNQEHKYTQDETVAAAIKRYNRKKVITTKVVIRHKHRHKHRRRRSSTSSSSSEDSPHRHRSRHHSHHRRRHRHEHDYRDDYDRHGRRRTKHIKRIKTNKVEIMASYYIAPKTNTVAWLNCSLAGKHTLHIAKFGLGFVAHITHEGEKRKQVTRIMGKRYSLYVSMIGDAMEFRSKHSHDACRNAAARFKGGWEAVQGLKDKLELAQGCSVCLAMPIVMRKSKNRVLNDDRHYDDLVKGIRTACVSGALQRATILYRDGHGRLGEKYRTNKVWIVHYPKAHMPSSMPRKHHRDVAVVCVDTSGTNWKRHHFMIKRPWNWHKSRAATLPRSNDRCPKCGEHFHRKTVTRVIR